MLVGIVSERLPKFWHLCAPLIDKAIQSTECDFDIDDIYIQALEKRCQIWVWIENDEIIACFVTVISIFPKRKICSIPLIGGKGLRAWRNGVDEGIGVWAKNQGCTRLEGYARKGWLRILTNWKIGSTTIRREL